MTEDEIKSIIQYAIKQFGNECGLQDHSDHGVADAINGIVKGEGNILGIAQALFLIGESLAAISSTYTREINAKLGGRIE
jgi:hypothetical protein